MKYLKLFESNSDYEGFVNSDEYVLPNVSYISSGDVVKFSPVVKSTSQFTLEYEGGFNASISGQFEFEEGMTWADWCDSEYNVYGFCIENGPYGDGVFIEDIPDPMFGGLNGGGYYYWVSGCNTAECWIHPTDKIIPNHTYYNLEIGY